jgi:hypothetical protein
MLPAGRDHQPHVPDLMAVVVEADLPIERLLSPDKTHITNVRS